MKRSLALALTVVIFAAIAVCFLRPAPPDFGYAASYDGRPIPLELEGDAEYFECAELIDVDCVVNETVCVRLRPTENTYLIPSTPTGAQESCRIDLLSVGWFKFPGEEELLVQLDVRPNRGTPAPYVLRGDGWRGPSVEQRGILAYSALEAVDDEGFVTVLFAENPDGSGEQYTLALDFEYAVEQIEDMP